MVIFPRLFLRPSAMPATQLTGIVTKAGAMAKTVTMTVEKVKMHPKLLKVGYFRSRRRTSATKSTLCMTSTPSCKLASGSAHKRAAR